MKRKLLAIILVTQMITVLDPAMGDTTGIVRQEKVYAQTVADSYNNGKISKDFSTYASTKETPESDFEWRGNTIKKYIGDDEDVISPQRAVAIGNQAFSNCDSLKSVVLPDSVRSIGEFAFNGCSSLSNINMPKSLATIEDGAFENCESLTKIVIPSNVRKIGTNAFCNCTGLTYFEISSNVLNDTGTGFLVNCINLLEVKLTGKLKSIPEYMFVGADSLEKVNIPSTVKKISNAAFSGCRGLRNVTIPNGVVLVEDNAFRDCDSLTSINIPASVESIGDSSFAECDLLEKVIVNNSTIKISATAMSYDPLLIIRCHKNSTAHKYALENGIKCDPTLGNGSGNTVKVNNVNGLKIGGRASNALRLNWNSDSKVKGHIVEQYKGGKWVRIARLGDNKTNTYRISNLSSSSIYKFRVKSFKFSGKQAVYGKYAYINGKTCPSNVVKLKIGGTAKNALRLNWNKNIGARGYIIEQYNGKQWVRIKKITSNKKTTFRVEKLTSKKKYKFRVKAYSFDGNTPVYSGYSYINGNTR